MTPALRAAWAVNAGPGFCMSAQGGAPIPLSVTPGDALVETPGGSAGDRADIPADEFPADTEALMAVLDAQLAVAQQGVAMTSMLLGLIAGILLVLALWLGGRR